MGFKYDTILRERMNQLEILDWQDLGEKAGLSRYAVRLVRQGDVGNVTLDQLRRLATVLNLNFQEFDRTLSALCQYRLQLQLSPPKLKN